MTKKNNGSGKFRADFDEFIKTMSKKYNMPQAVTLEQIEQMAERKYKELKRKRGKIYEN